jgi:hypothetical protein
LIERQMAGETVFAVANSSVRLPSRDVTMAIG